MKLSDDHENNENNENIQSHIHISYHSLFIEIQ